MRSSVHCTSIVRMLLIDRLTGRSFDRSLHRSVAKNAAVFRPMRNLTKPSSADGDVAHNGPRLCHPLNARWDRVDDGGKPFVKTCRPDHTRNFGVVLIAFLQCMVIIPRRISAFFPKTTLLPTVETRLRRRRVQNLQVQHHHQAL